MTANYPNPALDAELAYRREQLVAAGRRTGSRHWTLRRREA
jgi:hypothetical protein